MMSTVSRPVILLVCLAAGLSYPRPSAAQPSVVLDEVVAPGANYDKAEFRFWKPSASGALRGVVVLVPGSNGDGRAMAEEVFWQEFAKGACA